MKIKNILFDLDNTLVRCMEYYEFIRKNLIIVFSKESGLTYDKISELLENCERARILEPNAFTKQAFLESINNTRVAIYRELLSVNIDNANAFYASDVSFKLINFASKVYSAPYSIYEDVIEVLNYIKSIGISMHVVTKGSFYAQARKASMFGEIFDGLFVLPKKDADTWRGVVESMKLNPSETIVVGDSVTDDINPAIKNGMLAVRIRRRETSWIGDPKTDPLVDTKCISNLKDLISILETEEA